MQWKMRWGYLTAKTARRGIFRLKTGGFYVRSRVTDPRTSKRKEVSAVLRDASMTQAQAELDRLVDEARVELRGEVRTTQTWRAFAISRLEERMLKGKVMSEATVDRWKEALSIFVPEWGHLEATAVTRHHINLWLNGTVAKWMTEGKTSMRKRRVDGKILMKPFTSIIKPTTVNGWLRVLRAISHAIKVTFDLTKSAFDGIEFFEEGRIYTREEPNALHPDMLPKFMGLAKKRFPQHFAMIFLGVTTGLRPSSMRPLRRKGPAPDVDWETGLLQIRRSHSRRQIVMEKTKTGKDTTIALSTEQLAILKAHSDALTGKMAESDLLFPSDMGTLRTRNVLAKPFAAIASELGITFRLTPRGMRRTFNDAARVAGVNAIVKRSISGHLTDEMDHHYSTARDEEQREALARVTKMTGQGPSEAPS